jgi:hypothetical protein
MVKLIHKLWFFQHGHAAIDGPPEAPKGDGTASLLPSNHIWRLGRTPPAPLAYLPWREVFHLASAATGDDLGDGVRAIEVQCDSGPWPAVTKEARGQDMACGNGGDQRRKRWDGGRRSQAEGMRWWSLVERYPLFIWRHGQCFDQGRNQKLKF